MNRPDFNRFINRLITWICVICAMLCIQYWMIDYMYNDGERMVHWSINVIVFVVGSIFGFYLQHKMRK